MADPQVVAAVEAQALTLERIRVALASLIAQQVRSFAGWYSTAEITRWTAQLAALAEASQRQTAATTDAYLTRVASQLSGRPVRPSGAIDVAGLRRNITHPGVYGRLADQWRYQVSQGTDEATALDHVLTRAGVIAATDLALAEQQQEARFMVVHSVDGWRRVVHPELSKGGTCGLCIAAADRVYTRGDLKALHAKCACTVLPIINGKDPGQSLNKSDLDALYQRAGANTAAALKRVKFSVHDHGELGPVLQERGQDFRGPRDVAADLRAAS